MAIRASLLALAASLAIVSAYPVAQIDGDVIISPGVVIHDRTVVSSPVQPEPEAPRIAQLKRQDDPTQVNSQQDPQSSGQQDGSMSMQGAQGNNQQDGSMSMPMPPSAAPASGNMKRQDMPDTDPSTFQNNNQGQQTNQEGHMPPSDDNDDEPLEFDPATETVQRNWPFMPRPLVVNVPAPAPSPAHASGGIAAALGISPPGPVSVNVQGSLPALPGAAVVANPAVCAAAPAATVTVVAAPVPAATVVVEKPGPAATVVTEKPGTTIVEEEPAVVAVASPSASPRAGLSGGLTCILSRC